MADTHPTEDELAKAKRFMPRELSSMDRAEVWLEMASLRVGAAYFGSSYSLALSLMASHIGSLEERGDGGATGSVSSKSEGNISVGYSGGGDVDGDLGQTTYGRQYLALLAERRVSPGISGVLR